MTEWFGVLFHRRFSRTVGSPAGARVKEMLLYGWGVHIVFSCYPHLWYFRRDAHLSLGSHLNVTAGSLHRRCVYHLSQLSKSGNDLFNMESFEANDRDRRPWLFHTDPPRLHSSEKQNAS